MTGDLGHRDHNCISKDKGATADEIVAVLVKAFPDREADGMRKTVLIQGVDQTPFDGAACGSTVGYFIYRTATLA
jgi:hypothetical protein